MRESVEESKTKISESKTNIGEADLCMQVIHELLG